MRPSFLKNNFQLALVCICGALLFLPAGVFTYRHGNLIVHEEIKSILYESLTIDITKRIKEANINFVYAHDSNSSFENTILLGQDTTDFSEYKPPANASIDSKLESLLQSFLLQKRPIDIKNLDSMYSLSLAQRDITAQTAIRYTNNLTKETFDSKPNSKLYTSTYALDKVELGIQHEMTIQPFVKPSPICVIRKAKKQFILVYSTLFLLMGFSFHLVSRRKIAEEVPPTGEYEIATNMYINVDKQTLRHNKEMVNLSPQSVKILKLLLEAPDHFMGYEDFENALWGNLERAKERREKAVKRLRDSLDTISELHIVSIWGSGYQLIIGSKQDAEKAETSTSHTADKSNKHGGHL